MPDFNTEKSFPTGSLIAGIDEAGRGPWAGPVVAGAVIFKDLKIADELAAALNDSKKLSAKKREELFKVLKESDAYIGVGIASEKEIDEMNILQATFTAMHRALEASGLKADFAIVDGNRDPKLYCPSTLVVKGDSKCLSIAAASIIAKVTRDKIMADLALEYPQYGWDKNAGYGTKDHINALEKYGVTPYHRKSYAPIRKLLEKDFALTP
ncbi:MAG: ribonuclease HII [Alphaproteobacteria bacterium]|nr:ribonuclease HII [Alphaproteobacteria bacterium]